MAMTIHQLRIFWAVAQAKSYTKASKMLGLAQPSLSQQISKLEEVAGSRLFNRGFSQIQLTDTGNYLYAKAEEVIANIEETEEGLKQFANNTRGVLKIGMLSSVARNLLPPSMKLFYSDFPDVEINVLEVPPAEAIDLLYARQLNIAVVAADSIAAANLSFASKEIYSDPYVLAVPNNISLDKVDRIDQLTAKEKEILDSSIIFEFGNQHKKRIDDWFKKNKITAKVIAHTRSYEVALSMVEAGLGVAVLPALTSVIGLNKSYDVNLYKTSLPDRRLVSLVQKQFINMDSIRVFIKSLATAGSKLKLPAIKEEPNIFKNMRKEIL